MFKFENFSLYYDEKLIVEIADLELISSGHIIICGEIGSGKSSIAKALIGYQQHEGQVFYQNQEIKNNEMHPEITYVPQNLEYYFIMNRIVDEIMFSSGLKIGEIEELLKKYGLLEAKDRSPQSLSGGEKVRLVALLSEIKATKVLILDETIAMNDYKNLKIITTEINKLIENNILVIEITHDMNRFKLANQLVYVKDHSVTSYDSVDELIKNNLEIKKELEEKYDNM